MAEKKAAKKPATKKTAEKKAEEKKTTEVLKGHVVYGSLYVRSAPKKDPGNITRVLEDGAKVEILDKHGEWYQIKDGFVMAKYIAIE